MRHRLAILASSIVLPSSAACAALSFDDVDVELWVGAGDHEALMVVDWLDGRNLAFGYRWSALESPSDRDMLEAIDAATDRFVYTLVPDVAFDAVYGIGWDADDDGFSPGDPDDWYEQGWLENGFWAQWTSDDGMTWDFGPGWGFEELDDGAWVGWSWGADFNAAPPGVPLVPAPPAAAALLLSLAGRRRRQPVGAAA